MEGGILAHVSVPEGIPAGSYVRFGGINAPVVSREDTRVMVQVPAHAIGLVDVEILTPAGEDLRIRNAFTYYDDTPAPVDVGPMPPRTALPSLDPIVPDPTAPVAGDPVVGDPGVGDPADPSPVDGECRSTAARGDGSSDGNSGNGNGSSCGRVGDGNNGGRAGGLPRTPGQPRIDPVMFQVGRLTLIDLDGVGPLADIDGASVLSQVCRTAVCPGRTV